MACFATNGNILESNIARQGVVRTSRLNEPTGGRNQEAQTACGEPQARAAWCFED